MQGIKRNFCELMSMPEEYTAESEDKVNRLKK